MINNRISLIRGRVNSRRTRENPLVHLLDKLVDSGPIRTSNPDLSRKEIYLPIREIHTCRLKFFPRNRDGRIRKTIHLRYQVNDIHLEE